MTKTSLTEGTIVVLVDGREAARSARARTLIRAGFSVWEAETGEQALELVEDLSPALLLLYVDLPHINGLQLCGRIRSNPATATTLVVQVSTSAEAGQESAPDLALAADAYLVEPVDSETLMATVRALLRMKTAEDDLLATNQALKQTNERLLRANQELLQREEELVRANRGLEQFTYAASHDLQEPLRTVSVYVDLLIRKNKNKLDEQSLEYAAAITGAAARMKALIADILHYSRSVYADLDASPVDLNRVLTLTTLNLAESIQASGACISADPLPIVTGDEPQLVAVFQNLISNSLKYRHPDREPQIRITSPPGDDCTLKFSDNGIGFDQVYAEKIFELFRRLHSQEQFPGTGVGLSMVKQIVERHGGKIWAEGRLGDGATFCCTLPLDVELNR